MTPPRLTALTKGSGCGCKVAPALLASVLQGLHQQPQNNLLVGNHKHDDAAVYKLENGQLLVSTVDFFTPVVDDPFAFGQVAAANALSDVYAMGGTPLLALAVMGFPTEVLPAETARTIMQGGIAKCSEAGVPLAGGHTIESPEPFFGLSVNGLVAENCLKTNTGARDGDLLLLSKPLGSGILNTAVKRGVIRQEDYDNNLQNMLKLNRLGSKLGQLHGVTALTDVTGFALLGHLTEMAEGAGLSVEIDVAKLPRSPGLEQYITAACLPDNSYRNWNSYEKKVSGLQAMETFALVNDPQTNGGLLIAVSTDSLHEVLHLMREDGVEPGCLQTIGHFSPQNNNPVNLING